MQTKCNQVIRFNAESQNAHVSRAKRLKLIGTGSGRGYSSNNRTMDCCAASGLNCAR